MNSGPILPLSASALRQLSGDSVSRFIGYLRDTRSLPPREKTFDRFLYGLAQPFIGARFLLRDRALLKSALYPALFLGLFCAAISLISSKGSADQFVRRFYRTFAALAPLPSILFARHYARLAATAHQKLGFGDCEPRIERLWIAAKRAVFQAILIVLAAAPALALLRVVPLIGKGMAGLAAAIWALHWIVIDALDDARVLEHGETLAESHLKDQSAPEAWFIRGFYRIADRLPVLGRVIRKFARFCSRLSSAWREEMAVAESHPWLMIGFGLTTAALLAIPVLNLLFRPIVILASVHLLGHLSRETAEVDTHQSEPKVSDSALGVLRPREGDAADRGQESPAPYVNRSKASSQDPA